MKKILVFGVLGLFVVGLVAAVAFFPLFTGNFSDVREAITGVEVVDDIEGVYTGEWIPGTEGTINNDAPSEREIELVVDNDGCDIETKYMSTLELTEKDSSWIPFGISKTISYTLVGDVFEITEVPEGYTLIYYPNTDGDDFATNVANIEVLSEGANGNSNLPRAIDVGDDYCGNGFNPSATQCVGAKLWLIPGTLTLEEAKAKVLAWDTTGFLFDTALIQYTDEGKIILSAESSLSITPYYKFVTAPEGDCTITTTVA